ncbi:MAG: 4-hydroxy-tetrahydrodipicolinate synthase, partial [Crenarchaeota archaeon]|nr:4-hydroxy-tetrahydrodipicolinate synthase [Thermoproteota archaeon]
HENVSGILAVGTTGESPTLDWNEHNKVIGRVIEFLDNKGVTIAGTGSNSTDEAIEATAHAQRMGVKYVLLVDPYYNGPSSLEICREYIGPIARQFPDVQLIPYIIPGRTGTQILPQDLATLHKIFPNVCNVKEATGSLNNVESIRKLCGKDFAILSGEDDLTYSMITSPEIAGNGVVSVTSNIAPRAVSDMIRHIQQGNIAQAQQLNQALKPLFDIITVKTQEPTDFGPVLCKARNPLAYKTLMNILGMPSGPCRRPLGKMTRNGIEVVLAAIRTVYENNPEILIPIENFFDVDLKQRLYNEKFLERLYYA